MVYSPYKKLRIIFFHHKGLKAPEIAKRLLSEGIGVFPASRQGIHRFLKRYVLTGSIGRKEGSGRRSKVTEAIKVLVENQMREDDETSVLVAFL